MTEESKFRSIKKAPRPNMVWGVFGLLGLTNITLVGGGVYWLASQPVQPVGRAAPAALARPAAAAAGKAAADRAAELNRAADAKRKAAAASQEAAAQAARTAAAQAEKNAAARAARLAKAVFAVADLEAVIVTVKRVAAEEGVSLELAGRVGQAGGSLRVLASNEAGLIGQPPDGGLVEALQGKRPAADVVPAGAGDARAQYTAYFTHTSTEVITETTLPVRAAAKPAAPKVERPLRVITRTVKQSGSAPATTHVVKPGDTLYKISRTYYGDASQFYAIWQANRAKIPNRSNLIKGTVLNLPPGGVVTGSGETEVEQRIAIYADGRQVKLAPGEALPAAPVAVASAAAPAEAVPAAPVETRRSVPVPLALRITLPMPIAVAANPLTPAARDLSPGWDRGGAGKRGRVQPQQPYPLSSRPTNPFQPPHEPAQGEVARRAGEGASPAAPMSREAALALALAAMLGVGLSWWGAGLLLNRRRRRELERQKAQLLGVVGERFRPHAQLFDRNAVRSPWQVEHAQAVLPGDDPGGSFADFRLFSESRLGIFIGDATGRNATALIYRGVANLLWRTHAADQVAPGRTLLDMNRHLVDYISQGDHVTAHYAQVDLLSGAVSYATAAHTGAFVLGRRGGLTMLSGRGMPLGVGQELFADRLEQGHVRLNEGESLLLFTDGLLKAENQSGEPFGLERLEKCLRERPGCNAEEVVATIRQTVETFVGHPTLDDEAAIVCLRLVTPLVLYPKLEAVPIGNGITASAVVPAADEAGIRAEQ